VKEDATAVLVDVVMSPPCSGCRGKAKREGGGGRAVREDIQGDFCNCDCRSGGELQRQVIIVGVESLRERAGSVFPSSHSQRN